MSKKPNNIQHTLSQSHVSCKHGREVRESDVKSRRYRTVSRDFTHGNDSRVVDAKSRVASGGLCELDQ